ncbi:MAG: MarR family transcriptional regulator [Patulibacter sp.]
MGEALRDPAFFAWYGVLQLQARTTELIVKELEARTGLPASWYELMACLSGGDEHGCRMNELADELLISRGGATKLVARLEQAGYVERITPPDDRRATYARLTAAGRAAVEAAHPVQLELTRRYFGEHLTAEELDLLARTAAKVLRGIGAECAWLEAEVQCGGEPDDVPADAARRSAPPQPAPEAE